MITWLTSNLKGTNFMLSWFRSKASSWGNLINENSKITENLYSGFLRLAPQPLALIVSDVDTSSWPFLKNNSDHIKSNYQP